MAASAPVPANRLGVHALVFTGRWDTAGARRAVTAAKTAGYDLIELALLDPHAAAGVVRDPGGDTLAGVLYSSLGRYTRPPTARGRANAVHAIQKLADHAAASGIRLALEVVNRYETNLLNTWDDPADLARHARQAIGAQLRAATAAASP